jgi:hypothetical protein
MRVDIIDAILSGELTADEAEAVCELIMDMEGADLPEALGLSSVEWTAYAHGVWFDELAQWRQEGWPRSCFVCKGSIVPAEYGWIAKSTAKGHRLIHIRCLGQN